METLQELKQQREALDKQIAELEAKEWPKRDDVYWSISTIDVYSQSSGCSDFEEDVKNGLGLYRTEAEAQHYFKYFKLLREIDQFCEERNPKGWDWKKEQEVCGLDYVKDGGGRLVIECWANLCNQWGKLKEERHPEELLEKFGDRIMEVINFKK